MKKFIDSLRSVSLTKEERAILRTALLANIRAGHVAPEPRISVWSWFSETRHVQVAFLSFIILVSGSGTVSIAAENSLPGEALYPIKTKVNEGVARLILTNSATAEADFETVLLEKRLEEAEALDKEQRLTVPLKETVREVVRAQSLKAEAKVYGDGAPPTEDVAPEVSTTSFTLQTMSVATDTATSTEGETSRSVESPKEQVTGFKKVDNPTESTLQNVLQKHKRILDKLNSDEE